LHPTSILLFDPRIAFFMHAFFIQPLLAVDFTHLAITLVVIFIAVMRQLFEASKQANKKRAGGPNPLGGPPQPQPKPIQAGGQQADPLRNQVEEFLKRASQRPQGPQEPIAKSQTRPASEIEILLQESRQALEQRDASGQRAAESRPAQPPQRPQRRVKRRQSVAEHVAEQVASRSKSLAEKASQLGRRIVAEDEQFDVQLKAKFDHSVGTLAGSVNPVATPPAPPPADTPALQIATLLANPEGVRQAVIVNEILRRPSERW
jgi:hypothetical protein